MKQSYSTKELAEMWDVSESTVKRWADAGALPCRKTVGGHRKFELDDIVEFQSRCGLAKSQAHAGGRSESPCEFKHLLETADYPALAERFRQAALAGQFNFVTKLFNKSREHGVSLATIGEELIRPAMREVGEMWRTGKISLLDEHLATLATIEALGALQAGGEKKAEAEEKRLALVGCAEGELHQLAAMLVRDLLESEGWRVIYFSSPTPLFSFAEAVDRFKPQLVCISITMADNIERARRDYEDLRRAADRYHTKVVLGGAALTDAAVRARFPESVYAGSLHDLLDLIQK
ncbi:MAG TPA: B12-binding domain-containing protein [Blastocatellia bacterium]|nr:B12-binding domain-containing protein [Blastocatellia bacterium]